MAGFWDWRPQGGAATAERPIADTTPELALQPVEIYTSSAIVHGLVAPEGRRLSDMLNSNSVLAMRNVRSVNRMSGVEANDDHAGWTRIHTDDILFVMPPQHESPRQLRVHRRQHRVRIETGGFALTGNVHMPPGTRLDPYVLRTRVRFVALTGVEVFSTVDPTFERTAPVVLVNVRPVTDLTEVVTAS